MADDLPDKVDVAILGGGLAGLWLAHRLADHADVLLVDDRRRVNSCLSSSLGIAAVGQGDNPARLAAALGKDRSEDLWRWSRRAVSLLEGLCNELGIPVSEEPVLRFALDVHEEEELRRTAALISEWETSASVRIVESGAVRAGGLGDAFRLAICVEGDAVVPLAGLGRELSRRLTTRVATATGRAVVGNASLDGVVIEVEGVPVVAELVVICSGAAAGGAHPAFGDLVFPVRVHASRIQPGSALGHSGEFRRGAGLARHRFEAWTWRADGGLDFAGCRWAEGPEMGAGDSDVSTLNPAVLAAHDAYVERHLGLVDLNSEVARRTCGVTAYTCDGLPLVGPLLGAPRVLAMLGWGGWGLSAIGAAVEDLTFALLGRPDAPASPRDLLGPRRML